MKALLTGGIFSWIVILWSIISIIFIIIMYKRSPKHILIILGTFLGSIIFSLGVTGLFAGLSRTLRLSASIAYPEIENLVIEGNRIARIPFSIGTVVIIIYFVILSIIVTIKKGILKKWSLWIGWLIFLFFTFVLSWLRHSLNVNLIKGFGKITTLSDTIPETIYPFIRTGRLAVFTSLLLSLIYLLVAILITIRKGKKKKIQTAEATVNTDEKPETID